MPARNQELLARSRQPGVDARIDPNQLFGPQTEFCGEIVQGVLSTPVSTVLILAHHRRIRQTCSEGVYTVAHAQSAPAHATRPDATAASAVARRTPRRRDSMHFTPLD